MVGVWIAYSDSSSWFLGWPWSIDDPYWFWGQMWRSLWLSVCQKSLAVDKQYKCRGYTQVKVLTLIYQWLILRAYNALTCGALVSDLTDDKWKAKLNILFNFLMINQCQRFSYQLTILDCFVTYIHCYWHVRFNHIWMTRK